MSDTPISIRAQRAARAQRMSVEAEQAWQDHAAEEQARDLNIERLRALRVARDEAAAVAAPPPAAPRRAAKPKVKRVRA